MTINFTPNIMNCSQVWIWQVTTKLNTRADLQCVGTRGLVSKFSMGRCPKIYQDNSPLAVISSNPSEARFRRRSIDVLHLTGDLSTAKERRLNQFGKTVFIVWCGKSVKFIRVCQTYQALTGKIYLMKQHFLLPATVRRFTIINNFFKNIYANCDLTRSSQEMNEYMEKYSSLSTKRRSNFLRLTGMFSYLLS